MTIPWRVVRSLTTLRLQINAACPGRATGADGTIGDASHVAEGNASDHNPHLYPGLGSTAVVCALDITHDPAHGADTYAMADALRRSRDPRIGYLISNRRITGPNHGWNWDAYHGTGDPHTGHMHVSSVHTAIADSETPWQFTPTAVLTGATMSHTIDDVYTLLSRALNGFTDKGTVSENLVGAWIGGFQSGQNATLAAVNGLSARVDTLTTKVAGLSQPAVDASAVAAQLTPELVAALKALLDGATLHTAGS